MAETSGSAVRRNNRISRGDSPSAPNKPSASAPRQSAKSAPVAAPSAPVSLRATASTLATAAFSASVALILAYAWATRRNLNIVPEEGVGYWLGIAGSLTMLALLLYPLRKKFAKVAGIGRVATWFKLHMVMGIAGPVMIVLHSNFTLKSTNAIVAMMTMLTVVASGIVGRFLYAKIHKGLYGKKAEVKSLLNDADALKQAFDTDADVSPEVMAELRAYESAILRPDIGTLQSFALMFQLGVKTRVSRASVVSEMHAAVAARALRDAWTSDVYREHLEAVENHIDQYYATVRQAAGLKFYSRLFGWWHVLHLPLFFLLISAAIVHVIAVHLY